MTVSSKSILVLRFSAMGDVALLAPLLKSFLSAHSNHSVILASRPKFSAFFENQSGLKFFPADVDSVYTGVWGLIKLFVELKKLNPSVVIDMHDHLRSRFICFLFRIFGVKVVRFSKGRREKKQLVRKKNKIREELPHSVKRYEDAFAEAGFTFPILQPPYIETSSASEKRLETWLTQENLVKNETWFGIAPFAAHPTKIWPIDNYFTLIEKSKNSFKAKFFLFGGGPNEIAFFQKLNAKFPNESVIVAGKLKLPEELALMKKLDSMICVDSSNMHLATMLGVPTISIWGGTHPSAGFGPFGGENNTVVQVDTTELPCRPCSVYGKKTCWRGDMACLNRISVHRVLAEL